MIHHEICEGLGMRACETCVRNVERYTEDVRNATKTRIRPMATPRGCADWLEAPRIAADSTHATL